MESALTPRRRTLIFVDIIVACIATTLLSTALTTALPAMMSDLAVDAPTGQWLTSGYSLAMGIVMPLTAFLITRFRTKPLYLASLGVTVAGLAVSAVAWNFPVMMAGRVLQAIGNGALSSMAQVIILTIFPFDRRGAAMGWYGLSVSAAPVVAPTIAGVIVDALGWRWIFYLAIAVLLVAFVCAAVSFGDVLETKRTRFDVASFALSVLAFGGVTLGVGNLTSLGIADPACWAPIAVGAVSGAVFVVRQLKLSDPFLNLRILAVRPYAVSVVGSMLLYFVMMGSSVIMPLYVQDILGLSATVSGLVTAPGSLAMAVVSPFAGRIYDAVGMRRLFIAGTACLTASCAGMCLIGPGTGVWVAAVLNAVRCVAIGCLMMPLVTWGNGHIDASLTAHGTALLTSLRTIAGAIGSAVFVGVMTDVAGGAGAATAAQMHGLNVAFMGMTAGAVALLVVGVLLVRDERAKA